MENLLTVAELLKVLKISRSNLYRLLEKGELKAVRIGQRRLFRQKDIDAFIKKHLEK